jgi:hypothetical protein
MSYSIEEKKEYLKILVSKDFDIKNSTIEFNEKFNTHLERGTVYDWIKTDGVFKTEYENLRNELLDEAEKMHRLLRRGIPIKDESGEIIAWQEKPDRQALEFLMKTKGKDRGYIEKSELDVTSGDKPLNSIPTINLVIDGKKIDVSADKKL